ncbi:hypothetical protein [Micromonospora terminaliae]|nr:hypothetical protein [Micromonospora terminaliae]
MTVALVASSPAIADARTKTPPKPTSGSAASAPSAAVPAPDRARVLGEAWRTSTDRAWTTAGDADGLHLLIADESSGYTWRTVATLSEPGFEADQWIGNACLTASGRRAVVVYAPRTFTNKPDLFDRGGFSALVDLTTGKVRKLAVQSSLAYFNPGCGAGEEAVLTQGDEGVKRTRLLRVDTSNGRIKQRIPVKGQLTSAVPAAGGIVAADRGALVRVDAKGNRRLLVRTSSVPFRVAPDAAGGVVFMERDKAERAVVHRVAPPSKGRSASSATRLAVGGLTDVDVTTGRGGRVFVTGAPQSTAPGASASVRLLDVPAGSRISTEGRLALTSVRSSASVSASSAATGQDAVRKVDISARATSTGRSVSFRADPGQGPATADNRAAGRALSPAVMAGKPAGAGARVMAADPNNPADFNERYCSVPRNDPANQAMQPKPRQVEWAVDQAVRGVLNVNRPANWKNLNMPAYTPQGLFPSVQLVTGGVVPAQVMLGIAAQESNLWQAARFAVPGVTANPLIGNYFGLDIYNDSTADDWSINWGHADCGYGVMQVTDHMRLAGKEKGPEDTAWPYQKQRAVALDFAANIAAGLQILQTKWNQVNGNGLVINNGDASKIENWFFAVWAYNSGFYPSQGDDTPWGVGWSNNPVNPKYPANRKPFLDETYADAAHPQDWPYPEKVMGWAGHPVEVLEAPDVLVAGYRPAWWNGDSKTGPERRRQVKPPLTQFCDQSNDCEPGALHWPDAPEVRGEPAGPCAHQDASGRYDLLCWYHQPSTWKTDCDLTCGNELLRFDPGYAYQDDGTAYPPRCDLSGLPSNARVIDDVSDSTPSIRPSCPRTWTNSGSMTLSFVNDGYGNYPGKIDTHQIGGGFGGHFWFTHTRTSGDTGGKLQVNATWKLNTSYNGPMKVFVALPDHGAHTKLARYVVTTAQGQRERLVRQPGTGNRWVSIGAFMFNNIPQVSLSSVTPDGDGTQDIAFDAVAFAPIAGTFKEESVEAVAVFDEDQNIDAASTMSWLTGPLGSRQNLYDWGMEQTGGILALPACPASGDCAAASVRTFAQQWRDQVTGAGTDPVNHPQGLSIGRWIGFAQPYTDRPTSNSRPAHFDNDDRIKIRSKATVSFVADSGGKVIPGSEWVEYTHRTGNTHLPEFVMKFFDAVKSAYGIAPPNLTYRIKDLNAHNGAYTTANPATNGILPGRAYATAGKAPSLVDSAGNPTQTNATCVAALQVSGGSIGYRPMLGEDGPDSAMSAYVNRLGDSGAVPDKVRDLAEEIRELFFDNGLPGIDGSAFTQAAPIWQELNFKACSDGTVKQNNRPILRGSWMPDQYLYHNGIAMTQTGASTTSKGPLWTGNFKNFSQTPDPNQTYPLWPNAYGVCDAATDRSGNPWDMSPLPTPEDPGINPATAHFCVDKNLARDPSHSN